MPTPNKSKKFAQERNLKYYDKELLRKEILGLDRSNICQKDPSVNSIPYFTDQGNFVNCVYLNQAIGIYSDGTPILKAGTSRGEYFCFEVYDQNSCEEKGGIYYENNHPCYCLIPYDF